ncbi:Uma2 family endonuclease [Oscillatoria sp. FACHB-1406]|uniref:Uma2 family endonuclease n=1 Tax=Oscillatoria sp. FACHB-1406 TaxID=2692846 RepID=UPI0016856531|nr:Uma2 family endonuclease [Oscillatoria sp. FACHB-1406]MBD2579942.1 Uma2 family endonuclease [Oscillatoria sp. FACHB-1406]
MTVSLDREILYPDSDGQPMADNTKQYRWIVLIKENLELLLAENPEVFVAGDLLWYAVEGSPKIRIAPDVMIIFGRPKGDRGSYQQWKEDNIAPQVIFEILSPGNRFKEMVKKFNFYNRYGVEEYYIYDPDTNELDGLLREEGDLTFVEEMDGFTSPRLGIRFVLTPETLSIYRPDGRKFLTTLELEERLQQATQRAEQEAQRAERLAAKLRALGIDPDSES